MEKFNKLKDRLVNKIKMSATPVTGFILGLSGTDSIVTFILLSEVAKIVGFEVHGIHYLENYDKFTTFSREVTPWLTSNFPKSHVAELLVPNGTVDQFRWADLHDRAVNMFENKRLWVANTVNATESALGTYSIMSKSASIAPISSLYKSDVLEICKEYGVPEKLIASSRLPDCICGRDEFAADNIELIDEVLCNNLSKDYSAEVLRKAMNYIRDTKRENDFKNRTPYSV